MALPNVASGDPHVLAHNNERAAINALSTLTDPVLKSGLDAGYVTRPAPALERVRSIFATAARGAVPVVFLGHSYVWGLSATREDLRWVNQFTKRLQASYPSGIPGYEPPVRTLSVGSAAPGSLPGLHVYNGGISGAYSNSYVPQATRDEITLIQPKVVFHMIGVNDYGLGVLKADFKNFLNTSIAQVNAACTTPPIHVLVDQFAAPSKQNPVSPWSAFAEAMREISIANLTTVGYISIESAFNVAQATGWGAPDPYDLIHTDNLHPSNEGHALIAQQVAIGMVLPPPSGPGLPEVMDRFNRNLGANALGNADTGQPWAVDSGLYFTQGGSLGCFATGQATVNPGFTEAEVSSIVLYQANIVSSLVLRSSSDSTGLRVFLSAGGDNVVVNNGTTLISYSAALGMTVGREYHLSAATKGSQLTVHVNGKLVLTHTIAADVLSSLAGTKFGYRCVAADGQSLFKNFAVRRL